MNAVVAHVTAPKLGERANGDAVLVRREGDDLLIAVVDGLGHGPAAAQAAQATVAGLARYELGRPVLEMMQALHTDLRGTRGVAATVCIVRGAHIESCAVGNVQLACTNATIPLVLSSGVLGARVPKFRICHGTLRPRARIALFSDGISTRIGLDQVRELSPQAACQAIFDRHRKKEDDATILIADVD